MLMHEKEIMCDPYYVATLCAGNAIKCSPLHIFLVKQETKKKKKKKKKKNGVIIVCLDFVQQVITKTCLFKYTENFTTKKNENFTTKKNENFQMTNSDIFLIPAQNIDCGYSLEPPRRGGSNGYPQSMFLSRNKKNNVYPCKPQFYYIKVGFKGVKII